LPCTRPCKAASGSSRRYLALGQHRAGDIEAALETIDRAWELCGDENANQSFCAVVRANRAGILASQGKERAAQALAEADEAIVLMRKFEWEGKSEMAQGFESKALTLSLLGRQAEAEALQNEALAIIVKAYGPEHFESRRVQANLDKLRQARARP
jgi:tetratricopeptide (TPR) repeat protein